MGTKEHPWACIYRCNRLGIDYSFFYCYWDSGIVFVAVVGAGLLFGIGYGIFDANNMPILCQFVSSKYRATAYGIMNMTGVFAGAFITDLLGKWTDGGNLGLGFAMLAIIVFIALAVQLYFLRPKTDNME